MAFFISAYPAALLFAHEVYFLIIVRKAKRSSELIGLFKLHCYVFGGVIFENSNRVYLTL